MKMKALLLLPGAIALAIVASPVIPALMNPAIAAPGQAGENNRAGGKWGGAYSRLNLTDAQKAQMQQIGESTRQQMDAVLTSEQKEQMRLAKQNRQKPNLNLTEDQKTKLQAIRQTARSQMDAVLTADQKQQLQQMRQQARQRRQQSAR